MSQSALYFDTQILNVFAECQEYKENWDWDFCKKEINTIYKEASSYINLTALKNIDNLLVSKSFSSKLESDLTNGYLEVKHILKIMELAKEDNRQELKIELNKIKEKYTKNDSFTVQNFKSIDISVLKEFGFKSWNDRLLLIPLWVTFLLPNDFEVISIMNDTSTIGNCDKDVRFGCIAYGFNVE